VSLNVIVGPAQSGKKRLLLERFIGVLEKNPLFLVPSEAESIDIRKELLQTAGASVGASTMTYNKYLDQLAKRAGIAQRIINPVQQDLITKRLIDKTPLEYLKRSSEYAGFSKAITSFFNELKEGMNTAGALADAFDSWHKGSRNRAYLSDILRLYSGYLSTLEELDLVDEQLLRWEIVKALENDEVAENRPVFLYGFDDFTTSQRRITELLSLNTDITIAITYEDIDAFAERKAQIEGLLKSAHEVVETRSDNTGGLSGVNLPPEADMHFLVSAGIRGEVELAGAKILELLRSSTYKPDEIAVILRDPSRYNRAINQVFDDFAIPHSFNEPMPFAGSSLGRAVLSLLDFCHESRDVSRLVSYLRILHMDKQDLIDRFEREARLSRTAGPHDMISHWSVVSGSDTKDLTGLLDAGDYTGATAYVLAIANEILDSIIHHKSIGGTGSGASSGAHLLSHDERASLAAMGALVDTVESIDRLAKIDPGFSPRPADLHLSLSSTDIRVGHEAEADTVHILSTYRVRGRSYKVAFVLGLNEGLFPKSTGEDPFLNLEERRHLAGLGLELDIRQNDIAEERYLFYVATTRATQRLYLSYQSVDSDGGELLKSSFIADIQEPMDRDEVVAKTIKRPLSSVVFDGVSVPIPTAKEALRYAASIYRNRPDAAEAIAEAVDTQAALKDAVSKTTVPRPSFASEKVKEAVASRDTFSVSELETFIACPFKWYLERMLKPQPLETRLDFMVKGTLQHAALERFYRLLPERLGVHRPAKEKLQEMEALITEIFNQVFESESPDKDSIDARFARHEMSENLKRFIRAEAARGTGFIPGLFEATFGLPCNTYGAERKKECLDLGEGVRVRGRIDRIDIDDNNRAVVLDYKSGSIKGAKDIEDGKSLQLAVYIEAAKQLWGLKPVAGGFLSIARGTSDGLYNADAVDAAGLPQKAARSDEAFEEIIANALETIRATAARIKEGVFPPQEDYNACRYCGADHICRKKDAQNDSV